MIEPSNFEKDKELSFSICKPSSAHLKRLANELLSLSPPNRIGSSDTIGRVVLSCNAVGSEGRHWLDMLACPRRPIAAWHVLKDIDEVPDKDQTSN